MELRVIGMGKQAGVELRSMLENSNGLSSLGEHRPAGVLLLGVAGAVDPDLETGDLVLSSRYYRPNLDENSPLSPPEREARDSANPDEIPATVEDNSGAKTDFLAPDPALWDWALAAGRNMDKPVVYADSLTVSDLVTAPSGKQAIRRRYPVGILNMEDYWVASVAQEAGVPFISARAVLDPAQQALPGYLAGIAGSRATASLAMMAMPWRIPTLVGLARQLRIAQRALTEFAMGFLTQVSDATPALSYEAAFGAVLAPDRSAPR